LGQGPTEKHMKPVYARLMQISSSIKYAPSAWTSQRPSGGNVLGDGGSLERCRRDGMSRELLVVVACGAHVCNGLARCCGRHFELHITG
jgi:hypothetical protein